MPVRRGADIRKVIADAAQSRTSITRGCGSGAKDTRALAEQATSNGFRTQAEEDDANERAIMDAYIELLQEEEKEKWGEAYVPPSAQNPSGPVSSGGSSTKDAPSGGRDSPVSLSSSASSTSSSISLNTSKPAASTTTQHAHPPPSAASTTAWVCPICTLENPLEFLCCDACGVERPESLSASISASSRNNPKERSSEAEPAGASGTRSTGHAPTNNTAPGHWLCHRCGTAMEAQWWTCSLCGTMKLTS